MAYGIIGYSQVSNPNQPSGSIWGDCSSQELLDEASGFFNYADFHGVQTPPGLPSAANNSGSFAFNANYDSLVNFITGATSGNWADAWTRPMGPITPGSGQKIWFEALVARNLITAAGSLFVGLTNLAGMGGGNLVTATNATKNSNTLGATSGGQSFYGFWLYGSQLTNFDAVWGNNVQAAVTPSTVNLVLPAVLTALANNPNPGNPQYVPAVPPGILVNPTAGNANIIPPAFVKLGLRYDGQAYLYFYVNGSQVAKLQITQSMDITSHFGGIVATLTGASSAMTTLVDFVRTAALLVP